LDAGPDLQGKNLKNHLVTGDWARLEGRLRSASGDSADDGELIYKLKRRRGPALPVTVTISAAAARDGVTPWFVLLFHPVGPVENTVTDDTAPSKTHNE